MSKQAMSPRAIQSAIKKVFPKDRAPLSQDDCLAIRADLSMYSDEDVLVLLPQVMVALCSIDPNNYQEGLAAIDVVRFLDVPEPDIHESPNPSAKEDRYWRDSKVRRFSTYSTAQAKAIFDWLRYIESWEAMKTYPDVIRRVSEYWRRRANEK